MNDPKCPECASEYVARIRRVTLMERLMSIFYVYPFRCQLCGYRFSSVQWGVRYIRVDEDQREYERLPVSFPVVLAGDETDGRGSLSDISMGGCTIRSVTELRHGQIVSLSLQIPHEDRPIRVDAAVVRNVQLNRAGLEFLRFQQTERKRLQNLIRTELIPGARPRRTVDDIPTIAA